MDSCFTDNCQKKEWQRLRNLRLLQVRDQSRQVSQEILHRTQATREKHKRVLKAQREAVFEEWKDNKISELEEKYREAMQQVGLATKAAAEEPIAEDVLRERMAKNRDIAKKRGKIAEENEFQRIRSLEEKENAMVRRKQLTREVEDIRAGLVVQSRDWNVITQPARPVLLNIPASSVSNKNNPRKYSPLKPANKLKKAATAGSRKSPKVVRQSARAEPYSAPSRSPAVPTFTENLLDLPSSSRMTSEEFEESMRVTDLPEVGIHDWATYRINNRCPELTEAKITQRFTSRNLSSTRVKDNLHEDINYGDDDQLDGLLQRYHSARAHSPLKSARLTSFNFSPRKRLFKSTSITPPTKEDGRPANSLRGRKGKTAKSHTSETKKLFAAIDKALEEGKQLRGGDSPMSVKNDSNESSSNLDSSEAVVKLIVNVHCGRAESDSVSNLENDKKSGKKKEDTESVQGLTEQRTIGVQTVRDIPVKPKGKNDKVIEADSDALAGVFEKQPLEKRKEMRNVATAVGDSLQTSETIDTGTQEDLTPESPPHHRPCRHNNPRPCVFHFIHEPIQRSSTLADLTEREQIKSSARVSVEREQIRNSQRATDRAQIVNSECCRSEREQIVQSVRGLSGQEQIRHSESSSERDRMPESLIDLSSIAESCYKDDDPHTGVSQKKEEGARPLSDSSHWSSTMYLEIPNIEKDDPSKSEVKEQRRFKKNPVLDYYIRKLLDMPPEGYVPQAGSCTQCRCPSLNHLTAKKRNIILSSNSSHRSSVESIPSARATDEIDAASQPRYNPRLLPRFSASTKPRSHPSTHHQSQEPSHPRSHEPSLPRSHKPSHPRTHKPAHLRSLEPSLARSHEPSHPRAHEPSLPQSHDLSHSGPHEPSHPRSAASAQPLPHEPPHTQPYPTNVQPEPRTETDPSREEAERRLKRIIELKEQLAEIRKEQELLVSSSCSSSSRTTRTSPTSSKGEDSYYSTDSANLAARNTRPPLNLPTTVPQTTRGNLPEDLAHRLSTIMEVDSKLQGSALDKTAGSDTSGLSDKVEYLLRRNLIGAPFQWVQDLQRRKETETLSGDEDTRSPPTPTNDSFHLTLGLSSLESVASSPRQGGAVAECDTTQGSRALPSPREDLSQLLSKMDMSWAKRL